MPGEAVGGHEQRVEQLVHRDAVVGRDLALVGVGQLLEDRRHRVLVVLEHHQVALLVPLVGEVGDRERIDQLRLQRHRPLGDLVDQLGRRRIERGTGGGEHLVDQVVDRRLVLVAHREHRALPRMGDAGGRQQTGQQATGLPRPGGAVVRQLAVLELGLDDPDTVGERPVGVVPVRDVALATASTGLLRSHGHLLVEVVGVSCSVVGHRSMIARVWGRLSDGRYRRGMTKQAPDRNLALELVRTTEAAAIAAVPVGRPWRQGGRRRRRRRRHAPHPRHRADGRHRDHRRGREGRGARCSTTARSSATAPDPQVDIAVDPIDGTTLTSKGRGDAVAVIAVSEQGTMFDPGPVRLHGEDRRGPRGRRRGRHPRVGRPRTCRPWPRPRASRSPR